MWELIDRISKRLCGILAASCLIGCGDGGPERAEVHGSVTFADTPVESGAIAFIPLAGTEGPSTGGPIANGAYRIEQDQGPVVGPHRVEIRATRKTGRSVEEGSGGASEGGLVEEIEMFIPPQYNSDSTLNADIQPGSNEFNFVLKNEPAPRGSRSRSRAAVPDLP